MVLSVRRHLSVPVFCSLIAIACVREDLGIKETVSMLAQCEQLAAQNEETRDTVFDALDGAPYYFQAAALRDQHRSSVQLMGISPDRVSTMYDQGFRQFIFGLRERCDECSATDREWSNLEDKFLRITIVSANQRMSAVTTRDEIESHLDRARLSEISDFISKQGQRADLEIVDSQEIPFVHYQDVEMHAPGINKTIKRYVAPDGSTFSQMRLTQYSSGRKCPRNYSSLLIMDALTQTD